MGAQQKPGDAALCCAVPRLPARGLSLGSIGRSVWAKMECDWASCASRGGRDLFILGAKLLDARRLPWSYGIGCRIVDGLFHVLRISAPSFEGTESLLVRDVLRIRGRA